MSDDSQAPGQGKKAEPVPQGLPAPAGAGGGTEPEHFVTPDAAAVLRSIFRPRHPKPQPASDGKVASVKFMITAADERALLALGYDQAAIDRLKPQQVAEILGQQL